MNKNEKTYKETYHQPEPMVARKNLLINTAVFYVFWSEHLSIILIFIIYFEHYWLNNLNEFARP